MILRGAKLRIISTISIWKLSPFRTPYLDGLHNLEEVEILFWMKNTPEDRCQL